MPREQHTYCRICDPHCPLVAEIGDDGRIEALRPDRSHPCGGTACHKGLSFLEIHNDPDRLNWPMRRGNRRGAGPAAFAELGWDEAMAEIGARLAEVRERHGPRSVAIYHGNPFALGNSSAFAGPGGFVDALGTDKIFNANTQDASNKLAGAAAVYGGATLMIPDIANTDYLLCLGSNPRVSRWTCLSQPNDDLAVLRSVRARGGKIRFVNPRRTESSTAETGPTLLIRPGTDVYFLAALLNEIDLAGGFDEKRVARYGKNVDALRVFFRRYSADRVAGVVGISAATIRETAGELACAPSAAVYMGTGLNQSRQGVLCHWLVEMLNFVTGNLGRRGGTFKPPGLINHVEPSVGSIAVETSLGTFRLGLPIAHSALPASILPGLIEAGDIRALLVLGGNPLLTVGGERAMRSAAERLDLIVSVDIFRQATAELADYILPSTDWLEHADVNYMLSGVQPKPYVQYTDAVVPPSAGRRNGWWIMQRLLQATGLPSALDSDPAATDADAIIDGLLAARELTTRQMRELPGNSYVLADEAYDALYERCLVHADKKIDCCPAEFATSGLVDRCEAIFEELVREPASTLKLISLRTRYMHNSWFVNARKFRRGRNAANPLHMAEADAVARGLHDGDRVRVFNEYGSVETELRIDDGLSAGVVAMTHGYGNRSSHGLRHARRKPGGNCNRLMPVGADQFEPVSYMSWISGVPVEVEPAIA